MANSRIVHLRDYQGLIVEESIKILPKAHLLIESPTGSGKTTMALAIMAFLGKRSFDHQIIIAPMAQIESGFSEDPPMRIEWPDDCYRGPLQLSDDFIIQARNHNDLSSAKAILSYLKQDQPSKILVTTHSAFNYLFKHFSEDLPESFSRSLLAVDEAHAVGPNHLGIAVDHWETRSGRLLYLTATPYSGDGRVVLRPGMKEIRRTYPEHSDRGLYAPREVEHRVVTFGSKDDVVTEKQFHGLEATTDAESIRQLVDKMVKKWKLDGRPKVMIRVPPLRGGSGPLIQAIQEGFRKMPNPPVLFDASGIDKGVQKGLISLLASERKRIQDDKSSEVDIILGSQRLSVGTDWPYCSHFYTTGIPGSLKDVVQFLGRTTRKKPNDYPEIHRNTANITFFVPISGTKTLDSLSVDCSRHALMMIVQMTDYRLGEEWLVTQAVRQGFSLNGQKEKSKLIHANHGLDHETYSQVKLHMAAKVEESEEITVDDLLKDVREKMPKVSPEALNTIALGILAGRDKERSKEGDDKKDVAEKIRKAVARRSLIDKDQQEAMKNAFAEILHEMRQETLAGAKSLKAIKEQVVRFDGRSMRDWVEKLRGVTVWSEELIRRKGEEYRAKCGKYPSNLSGKIDGMSVEWGAADQWLRSIGSSLSLLFGKRTMNVLWAEESIREKGEQHKEKYGKYPNCKSGRIDNMNTTWNSPSKWATKNGTTLSIIFGQRTHNGIDLILKKREDYKEKYGKYPNVNSGKIQGLSMSWNSAYNILKKNGISISGRVEWSKSLIRSKAEEYRSNYGKYPHTAIGKIDGINAHWSAANSWLITQGTTLSKFLRENDS